MPIRPYVLAETNWKAVKETEYEVAVLPWGATEAHNYHLPYTTDVAECDYIAAEAAGKAWDTGARVIVLPTIPFGINTGQLDIKLDMNLYPSTQAAILHDVLDTMSRTEIRKLLILNGHGGNDFRQMIRELQPQVDVFLALVNWYACVDQRPFFQDPGDHAGEMETSVMMHVAPDLVLPLEEAGSGHARKPRIQGMREGWAWAPRPWTQVTDDTGVGDPAAATAQKGAQYLQAVTQRIGAFLAELAAADTSDLYR